VHRILLIATAGAAGALARYAMAGLVQRATNGAFPWGTFVVNAIGCFVFGILWSLAEERFLIGGEVRFVILVGFMGAFTTFSTFIFETGQLLRDAEWLAALGNMVGQNVVGLISLFLGLTLGRML